MVHNSDIEILVIEAGTPLPKETNAADHYNNSSSSSNNNNKNIKKTTTATSTTPATTEADIFRRPKTSEETEKFSDPPSGVGKDPSDGDDAERKVSNDNNNSKRRKRRKGVDGCWSWMVLAVSTFGTTVCGCSYSLFSLLYNDLIAAFETDVATAGWIGSIHVGCGNMAAVLLGVAVERFGCRCVSMVGSVFGALGYFLSFFATHIVVVYFTYGILAGIGMGMIAMASVVATQRCFDKRRAFAGAVVTVGFSIGAIISGLFMRYAYESTTWQGVCVIFAGFVLQMAVLSALAFGPPSHLNDYNDDNYKSDDTPVADSSKNNDSSSSSRNNNNSDGCDKIRNAKKGRSLLESISSKFGEYLKLCLEPALLAFLLSNFAAHVGVNTMYQHTPNRAIGLGITPAEIAVWPMASSISNLVAKMVGGVAANAPSVNRLLFYSASVFLAGLTHTLTPLCVTFTSIIVHGLVQNFFYGCFICLLTTIMVDMQGIENVAKTQALLALFVGTGVLISTPFAGYLYDVTKDYDVTFVVTGIFTIMATFLSLLSNYFHKKNSKSPIVNNE